MRRLMLREVPLPHSSPSLERLIDADAPTRPRAVAVLDGVLAGRAWTDDIADPRAAIVIEDADGTVFTGGDLTVDAVRTTLSGVRTKSGDLIFGFSAESDTARALVPAEPYWTGEAIDFADRIAPTDESDAIEAALPDDARVVVLDERTLPQTEWYPDTMHAFGSIERWMELGVGFAVMVGDEMAAESMAGPRCRGLLEMGVVTRERYRRRGFGTVVSQLTARACEARGDRVWWNANAANAPSLSIARRLGFRTERRYRLVACHADF
jgi:GNAT superfamily N-acetyltransferase